MTRWGWAMVFVRPTLYNLSISTERSSRTAAFLFCLLFLAEADALTRSSMRKGVGEAALSPGGCHSHWRPPQCMAELTWKGEMEPSPTWKGAQDSSQGGSSRGGFLTLSCPEQREWVCVSGYDLLKTVAYSLDRLIDEDNYCCREKRWAMTVGRPFIVLRLSLVEHQHASSLSGLTRNSDWIKSSSHRVRRGLCLTHGSEVALLGRATK